MPEELKKPKPKLDQDPKNRSDTAKAVVTPMKKEQQGEESTETPRDMVKEIQQLPSLKEYRIRDLVTDAKQLGEYLKQQELKTNQIRKFLDAINRLKFDLAHGVEVSKIETEVVMLKPKLVYAVARASKKQTQAIERLNKVMSAAIDRIKEIKKTEDLQEFKKDFERLVQLIESIIAYHKGAGGE